MGYTCDTCKKTVKVIRAKVGGKFEWKCDKCAFAELSKEMEADRKQREAIKKPPTS